MKVIKRNSSKVEFDSTKIKTAITKAFQATYENQNLNLFESLISNITKRVVDDLKDVAQNLNFINIEFIQDKVERAIMRAGEYSVAKKYILYRDKKNNRRELVDKELTFDNGETIAANFSKMPFHEQELLHKVKSRCYQGMNRIDFFKLMILEARALIETDYRYTYLASFFLNEIIRIEVKENVGELSFDSSLYFAADNQLINPALITMDLIKLTGFVVPKKITYLGLKTLYDRYLLKVNGKAIETPEYFFMRIAMGLAIKENHREDKVIEFYQLLSSFDFMCSTPTLFNASKHKPQLSSCYVSTVPDDLAGIFDAIKDNALLSKYAGGIGNDWTNVRAAGSGIKSTNGKSQGLIPFLKVANDTLVACNQSGKRRGSGCAYLEPWHLDIDDFIELRKDTGDERRRTHDMNTALWIPDLFMHRVEHGGHWHLFCPSEASDLHELHGQDFMKRYHYYEELAFQNKIRHKKIKAIDLWRKILTMLFETGHPWLCFKDKHNQANMQSHVGIIRSSNLCTEISLNTSLDEIAVCNLGSINIANHIINNELDNSKLEKTVATAIRILDNVIDLNFYPVPQAKNSNLKHRPIGLGVMGFQDALFKLKIPYDSDKAIAFAEEVQERIAYYAIAASTRLAKERGVYSSYAGSQWHAGKLPIDFAKYNPNETVLDWEALRGLVRKFGMRNSKLLAIAPTATISNICGVSQSIEPTYNNLYVKSNLSGEFTLVNKYLQKHLEKIGKWNKDIIMQIKLNNGSVQNIPDLPNEIYELYQTAFELDMAKLIQANAARQRWVDQAISMNIYLDTPSGRQLSKLYFLAWELGLKSTYYLRTMGATNINKSTCFINDPSCESCQ